jgi:hypothetical protein
MGYLLRNLRRASAQLTLAILTVSIVVPSTASALSLGGVQPWGNTTALPDTIQLAGAATYNGYIYSVGGIDNASTVLGVYYAKLGTDGAIGAWAATSPLPLNLLDVNVLVSNGYIYAIGGATSGSNGSNVSTVYYAKINNDGTLGTWISASSLLTATSRAAAVVSNGYIYEMGGVNNSNTKLTEIEHAKINNDGTLGTWTDTSVSLASATAFLTAVYHNGYIYEVGGSTDSGTVATADYIKVNNDGTLDSSGWTTTTALPTPITRANSVVNDGYLYEIGGLDGSSDNLPNVYYAHFNNDGSLGSWIATTNLPAGTYDAAASAYNGCIYVLGGVQGGGIMTMMPYAAFYTCSVVSSSSSSSLAGSSHAGYDASVDPNSIVKSSVLERLLFRRWTY